MGEKWFFWRTGGGEDYWHALYLLYIHLVKKKHKFMFTGTHVDLNPSVHFMDEDMFSDPTKHMPERWDKKVEIFYSECKKTYTACLPDPISNFSTAKKNKKKNILKYIEKMFNG